MRLLSYQKTRWIRHEEGYHQTYQITEGYHVVNLDLLPDSVTVDEVNNTVTIPSVIQNYDIILQLEKKQYNVTVTIIYEDGSREDQITTYTVPYGEKFETRFTIDQGYAIKKSQVNAMGASVNRSNQMITVNRVTDAVTVTITVR